MRYRLGIVLTAGSLCSAGSLAQSFNIDINAASGLGAGVPSASFAGAAQQPGSWNAVPMTGNQTVPLVGLDGLPTTVTFMKPAIGSIAGVSTPASGDFAKLVDDGVMITAAQGNTMIFAINNLTPGQYVVYTYGFDVGSGPPSIVTNNVSMGIDAQQVDGKVLGNEMLPGTAYTVHGTVVNVGTSIVLVVARTNPGDPSTKAGISGLQVRKLATNERIRLHVNRTPSVSESGASWSAGLSDLQSALSIAQRAGGGFYEIWTKSGGYRPTSGTDRNATFTIPSGLQLYGGFAGTETSLAQRTNPAFNITIMAGSIGASTNTDNSYTVVDASGTSADTIVDGFTISNGFNNGTGNGGGLRMTNGRATFRNCKFLSNDAVTAGAGAYINNSIPKFVNCLFYNNDTSNGSGGGIYATASSRPGLYNVQVIGNYAAGEGGGMHLNNSPAYIHNSLFSGNTASFNAGGLFCSGDLSDPDIRFSTFSANSCASGAGGIALASGADIFLYSSILWGNVGQFGATTEFHQLSLSLGAGSTFDMSHTTIEGLSSYSGFKCNASNPLFVDPDGPDNILGTTDDNCRLQPGSPAIDSASVNDIPADLGDVNTNGNITEPFPFDLDKKLRRVESAAAPNTGTGPAPFVDRGPYEFVPACPGDTNGDAMVNFADLNAVLSNFGQTGFGLLGDLNGDQIVNFIDLNIVLSNFGINC